MKNLGYLEMGGIRITGKTSLVRGIERNRFK